MTKRDFCIAQIKPYYQDRSLCGISETGSCLYRTKDGKMCVAGKNMINPGQFKEETIDQLLAIHGEGILKPEARNILSLREWAILQLIHDKIAKSMFKDLTWHIADLGLFSLNDLK